MSNALNIEKTSIDGVLKIKRPSYEDDRGFFHEVFRLDELESLGIKFKAV